MNFSFEKPDACNRIPLVQALRHGHEDMVLYLLSLPREENSPPMNFDSRLEYEYYPLLPMAAEKGMLGVVKLLLGHSADLLARDSQNHLAVCRAVRKCRVEVVNVLLEAHAAQGNGDGGLAAVVECPCAQDEEENAYPLLFHAIDREFVDITPDAQVAMVRCLVQNWGAKLRTIGIDEVECHPFFVAAMSNAQNMVDFFLDECGVDVNMTTPRTQETVLHAFTRRREISKRETIRMLKYLVEERGADPTRKNARGQDALDMAVACKSNMCIEFFSSLPFQASTRVTDATKLRRLEALERKRVEAQAAAEAAAKATEAELLRIREEQEAKAQNATAALLAELDAEEQMAAATAAKKKSKKANKKKGAGGQQAASVAVAASTAGRGSVVKECNAEDQDLVPGGALETEERRQHQQKEEQEEEGSQQQQEQQEQQERQRRRRAPQDAAQEAAVVVAVGGLSLNDVPAARTPTIARANTIAASRKGEDGDRKLPASPPPRKEDQEGDDLEKGLEEEKQDFFFDNAPDSLKCSIGFCFMTEAVVAMNGFSYQKSSLEKYIAHCAATGQALTSPLTGEPMGEMYMPNHHVRTYVKDYIGEREKEWRLHVAQRRAGREGK